MLSDDSLSHIRSYTQSQMIVRLGTEGLNPREEGKGPLEVSKLIRIDLKVAVTADPCQR